MVLIPKNCVIFVLVYVQTPIVPFWYLNVSDPLFGKPIVESTSIKVCAAPTCPTFFEFAWTAKLPYNNSSELPVPKDASILTL